MLVYEFVQFREINSRDVLKLVEKVMIMFYVIHTSPATVRVPATHLLPNGKPTDKCTERDRQICIFMICLRKL